MRTRIKGSCTRFCLNSLIFWMMMVVTDLGVKPEVFTKEKIPILVNWVFCLNKILKIEPKGRRNHLLIC